MNRIMELLPKGVSQAEIATVCGVSQQAVSQWFTANLIPAKRAKKVHDITNIPLYKLNPNVYPAPESSNEGLG